MTIDIRYIVDKLIENPSIKLIISTVGSIISFLTGGFGTILRSFVALLFLDLITGVAKSYVEHQLSSAIGRQGGKKILTYIIIIIFANLLDQAGLKGVRSFAILWASVTEGISIIENTDVLGFPWPPFLKEKLLQTKEKKFGGAK
ncbi:phage holin family protein [Halocella sp. SP3-1]|uniref:phage holin family protein n=1 Tax=Halocella sp. SP3-1 TaxID=2382161 RepID=UPI000F75B787|nr:phage holin family protein [Halocella sp. SP3-1]AZO96078.1 holin [Halocella sp. SP3-1]